MEVILFGGSFDPIHKGHIEIINKITNLTDKVIVIPNYLNPLKNNYSAPAKLRLKWLQQTINNPKVEISDYEIKQNKPCYTIDTIKHFKKFYDKISFVIGADNLPTLNKWKNINELKNLVEFIVVTRDNIPIKGYKTININIPISSTEIRNGNFDYVPKNIKTEVINFYKRIKMKERIEKIVKVLDDKKAMDIETFDLSDKDYFVDAVVIATTMGQKHGLALLDDLKKKLKPEETFLFIDESDDWTVIDLGDILIHLMSEEYRAKYQLEEFLSNFNRK